MDYKGTIRASRARTGRVVPEVVVHKYVRCGCNVEVNASADYASKICEGIVVNAHRIHNVSVYNGNYPVVHAAAIHQVSVDVPVVTGRGASGIQTNNHPRALYVLEAVIANGHIVAAEICPRFGVVLG